MKQATIFIIIIMIATTCVALFASCGYEVKDLTEDDIDYVSVSTVEDLKAMSPYGAYRLTGDIDFNGASWDPIRVWAFDGGGHTIKNCTITTNYDDPYDNYQYAGFFGTIKYLTNTTFENVKVRGVIANKQFDGIGIAAGALNWVSYTSEDTEEKEEFFNKWQGYIMPNSYIKNVVVKNSSIILTSNHTNSDYSTYIGGIAGTVCDAENCIVENCEISYKKTGNQGFNVGSVFGRSNGLNSKITSCGAENTQIDLEYNGSGTLNCGGFIAYSGNEINDSYTLGGTLTASITGKANIGGFVGGTTSGERSIINCMSKDNSITLLGETSDCRGTIGGFAGYSYIEILNCLSLDNTITIDDTTPASCSFNCAGFVGGLYTKGMSVGSVANSLSIGNNISNTYGDSSVTSGFYGTTAGTILYSGVKDATLSGGKTDIFGPRSASISSCIADSAEYGNENDLSIINEWDEETIVDTLHLSKTYWSISPKKIILTEFDSLGE